MSDERGNDTANEHRHETDHDHHGGDDHHDHHEGVHDHHDHHGGDGHHDHHGGDGHHHHDVNVLDVAVVTVSSSRTLEDDPSGDAIAEILEAENHRVVTRDLVGDERDAVQSLVNEYVDHPRVDAVVTTGGTGVTPDDVTVEAVSTLFSKELPGFGELFRRLSYEEIGTRVVGTRATAGVAGGVPIFCLPGSENAARLGVAELVVSEGPHLAGLAQRESDEE